MIGIGSIVYWIFDGELQFDKVVRIEPHLPHEDENYDRFWLENGCFIERWNVIDTK